VVRGDGAFDIVAVGLDAAIGREAARAVAVSGDGGQRLARGRSGPLRSGGCIRHGHSLPGNGLLANHEGDLENTPETLQDPLGMLPAPRPGAGVKTTPGGALAIFADAVPAAAGAGQAVRPDDLFDARPGAPGSSASARPSRRAR
jgi:hypothetical protein